MRSSVDFWYRLISRRATVPGLYLWGFLTPPVAAPAVLEAVFRAALVATDSQRSSTKNVCRPTLLSGSLSSGGLPGGLLGSGHCD